MGSDSGDINSFNAQGTLMASDFAPPQVSKLTPVFLCMLDDDNSSFQDSDSETSSEGGTGDDDDAIFELERPDAPEEAPQDETPEDPHEPPPATAHSHATPAPSPQPSSPSSSPAATIHYGRGAGEPLPANTGEDSSPEHAKYQQALNSPASNTYHPFQSRLEWEFARWAKFRGPSSTAVSELLGIEGVSVLIMLLSLLGRSLFVCYTLTTSRLLRGLG